MPQFRYQALNADKRPVAGEILAESVAQAIAQLEASGLSVQSIGYSTPERPNAPSISTKIDFPALTATEQSALDARLIQVVERGRALAPALTAYAAEIPKSESRRQLLDLIRIVQSGDTPHSAAALRRRPDYWIPLIGNGVASSDDRQLLQAILHEFSPATTISPRRGAWLLYPIIVICLAIAVFLLLGIVVIPVYRDIFAGFGLPLPRLTRLVLAFYASITSGGFIVVVVVIAIAALFANRMSAIANSSPGRMQATRPQTRSLAIAQLSRNLADLLDADFTPATSLRLASSAFERPPLKRAAGRVADSIRSPANLLTDAERRTVTSSVLFALQSDLSRRARSAVLREIGHCHEERARTALWWTRGTFEPIAILVVGFLVALTVIALYLPLFALIHSLS